MFTRIETREKFIDHMHLRAYLIRSRAPHVVKNHVHLAVTILSGRKDEVVMQCYVLLAVRHNFHISIAI